MWNNNFLHIIFSLIEAKVTQIDYIKPEQTVPNQFG